MILNFATAVVQRSFSTCKNQLGTEGFGPRHPQREDSYKEVPLNYLFDLGGLSLD